MRHRVEAVIQTATGFWVERLLDQRYPESVGKLRCIGGKIEDGEDPVDALQRELWEEYQIDVHRRQLLHIEQLEGPRGQIHRVLVSDVTLTARKSVEGIEELVEVKELPGVWK